MDKLKLNTIIAGDCIEKLKSIPDKSVDMVFADPPYNLQLNNRLSRPDDSVVNGVNDTWDKFKSFSDYDDFTYNWLKEIHRIMKDNATIWIIGSYHNIFRVGSILQNLGFWILNDIIWIKDNPMPNFKGTRFTNAHETLIWASKNQTSKYLFNYEAMKALNDDLQMRSDWNMPICPKAERLKNDLGEKVHSTQKPEHLLYRVILSSTKENDVILDPFFGTGTTGAVAKKLNRNFIGIEQDETYIKYATERIKNITKQTTTEITTKQKQIRVPFGNLIECGILKVGETLTDDKGNTAIILADGSLKTNNFQGSIHKVGAHLQKTPTCNGWKYWHLNTDKKMTIDNLRQDFIKQYKQ